MSRRRALGLPVDDPRTAWGAFALLLIAYAATMSRDLNLYDSAELALAAIELGLGHPTGQPVHTLLGWVFAHLPGVSPLFGLNLLSAVAGAACVIPALSLARGRDPQPARGPSLVSAAIVLPVALHPALWEPATRVEVYALAGFFALWAIARVDTIADPATPLHAILQAGIALGLAASTNPYTAIIAALSIGPFVLRESWRRRSLARGCALAVAGGLIGLLPYAYLPLAATREHAFVWGAPSTRTEWLNYLTGKDYARSRGISLEEWADHVVRWLSSVEGSTTLPWIALGGIGLWAAARGSVLRHAAPLGWVLTVLLVASNTVFSPDVPDYLGYFVPSLWCFAAGAALLARTAARPAFGAAICALLTLIALASPPAWFSRTRNRDYFSRALPSAVLHSAPRDAIVVVEHDQWAAPMLYLQRVERVRPDVVVLIHGLAASRWYWELLHRTHPALTAIELRGPGGRDGRVRRLLSANARRPVLVENLSLAVRLGARACPGAYFLRTGTACDREAPASRLGAALERWSARIGHGAPDTRGAIALAAFDMGVDLWRLGHARDAYRVLLSGVPDDWLTPALRDPPDTAQVPAFRGAVPIWQRSAALGDPARNLLFAGLLAGAAGDEQRAARLFQRAAEEQLPEARALLARAGD